MKALFQYLDGSWLALAVRGSTWIFAFTEVIHLIGITLLLGTLSVLNLRLMGVGLKAQTISEVAEDTHPWSLGGLILATASGIILAVSEALRLYDSSPFALKIALYAIAVTFTYTFHRRMTKAAQPTSRARFSGIVSMVLWFGVGFAGRAIAFY